MTTPPSELPEFVVARFVAAMDVKSEHIMNKLEQIAEALKKQEETLLTLTANRDSVQNAQYVPSADTSRSLAVKNLRSRGSSIAVSGEQQRCESDRSRNLANKSSSGSPSRLSPSHSTFGQAQDSAPIEAPEQNFNMDAQWDVQINEDGLPKIISRAGQSGKNKFQDHSLLHVLWHSGFDAFWLFVIALNAIAMGAQLQHHVMEGHYHSSHMSIDLLFTGLFILEFVLRLVRDGVSKYVCGSNKRWAAFDIFVLLLSFMDIFFNFISMKSSTPWSLRIIRVVRVLRIAKVIRGIRFLRDLRLLIVGMINSILSIAWTVIALTCLMYVGAVIVMSVVIEDVEDGKDYYVNTWGGIPTSMCTLFQVMTGDGWWTEVVAGMIIDYPGMQYLFMAYYAVTAYGLLNIVTGIFVEQTLSAAKTDIELLRDKRDMSTKALQSFFKDLFDIMDGDGNGEVDFDEFETCVKHPQIAFAMGHTDLKADDVLKLFLLLDKSSNGVLSCDEFVKGCMMLRGHPTLADIVEHGVNTKHMLMAIRNEVNSCNRSLSKLMAKSKHCDAESL